MPTQATLCQPAADLAVIDNVAGLPSGILNQPYTFDGVGDFTVEGVIRASRFPVPPAALGFLTDITDEAGDPIYPLGVTIGLQPPYYVNGAVNPPGNYLEPTTGQIWPRVG